MPRMKSRPAHRPCPACASLHALYQGRKTGFDVLRCEGCGSLFTVWLPREEAKEDYDSYYRPDNLETPEFMLKSMDEIVAAFSSHRQSNRLLDVGFGAGGLLRAAVRAGWDAEGVEVSAPAVEHARMAGLKVFNAELEQARYPDHTFDVVMAVEVLEHVPDPAALVREIARILRPGGLLWATTPHGSGLSARLLGTRWSVVCPPEHLQLLSGRGIQKLLGAAGFSSTQVATQGINPYEIVHVLRQRHVRPSARRGAAQVGADAGPGFDRNQSGFQLNELMTASPSRRAVKTALNGLLSATRLGDTSKIRAVR